VSFVNSSKSKDMSGAAIDNRGSKIGSTSGSNKKATKASSKTDGGSGVQLTEIITTMPTGSPDGAWMKWLFGIAVTIVVTLVTTVITLVRIIEGKYRTEVTDLKQECKELRVESEACRKDREDFRVRIATLEAQIELPQSPINRRGK
jgi:mannitol-specific phosphotransferase system IIBC component